MHRVPARAAATVLTFLLVLTACSKDSKPAATRSASNASDSSNSSSQNQIIPGKTKFGANDDDAIITKAIDDVQSFYEEEFPKLYGEPFKPLSGGIFPYGPDNPPPNCGGPGLSDYQEVA